MPLEYFSERGTTSSTVVEVVRRSVGRRVIQEIVAVIYSHQKCNQHGLKRIETGRVRTKRLRGLHRVHGTFQER